MQKPHSILSEATSDSNLVDLTELRLEKLLSKLTPEQRLKVEVLTRLLGSDQVEGVLVEGISIDRLFTLAAEVVFYQQRR